MYSVNKQGLKLSHKGTRRTQEKIWPRNNEIGEYKNAEFFSYNQEEQGVLRK